MSFGEALSQTSDSSLSSTPLLSSHSLSPYSHDLAHTQYSAHPQYAAYHEDVLLVLQSFDKASDWADFIDLLTRLGGVFRRYPQFPSVIPSILLCGKRLSQCLNPALPSGVHMKALEIYQLIFSRISHTGLAKSIHIFSSGLFPLSQYASTNVKVLLMDIFESEYLRLGVELSLCLPGFIVAVLPGLEDETSIFHSRTMRLLSKTERRVDRTYFFSTIWRSLRVNPPTRLQALHYLLSRLPSAELSANQNLEYFPPECGVLRSIHSSLIDPNILVQRHALDVLTLHCPFSSNTLFACDEREWCPTVEAALMLLLRRETSLTRRITSWVFGPSPDTLQCFRQHTCAKVIVAFKRRFGEFSSILASLNWPSSSGAHFEKELKSIPKLFSFFKLLFHDFPSAAESIFSALVPAILNVIYFVSGVPSISGDSPSKIPGNIFVSIQQSLNSLLETIADPCILWSALFKVLGDTPQIPLSTSHSPSGASKITDTVSVASPVFLLDAFMSILYPEFWTTRAVTLVELMRLFTLLQHENGRSLNVYGDSEKSVLEGRTVDEWTLLCHGRKVSLKIWRIIRNILVSGKVPFDLADDKESSGTSASLRDLVQKYLTLYTYQLTNEMYPKKSVGNSSSNPSPDVTPVYYDYFDVSSQLFGSLLIHLRFYDLPSAAFNGPEEGIGPLSISALKLLLLHCVSNDPLESVIAIHSLLSILAVWKSQAEKKVLRNGRDSPSHFQFLWQNLTHICRHLWHLLAPAYTSLHIRVCGLFCQLDEVDSTVTYSFIADEMSAPQLEVRCDALRKFSILWRSSGDFESLRQFVMQTHFVNNIFRMFDALTDPHPLIRSIAVTWLLHSLPQPARFLDPLFAILFHSSSKQFPDSQFQGPIDVDRVLYAFHSLSSVVEITTSHAAILDSPHQFSIAKNYSFLRLMAETPSSQTARRLICEQMAFLPTDQHLRTLISSDNSTLLCVFPSNIIPRFRDSNASHVAFFSRTDTYFQLIVILCIRYMFGHYPPNDSALDSVRMASASLLSSLLSTNHPEFGAPAIPLIQFPLLLQIRKTMLCATFFRHSYLISVLKKLMEVESLQSRGLNLTERVDSFDDADAEDTRSTDEQIFKNESAIQRDIQWKLLNLGSSSHINSNVTPPMSIQEDDLEIPSLDLSPLPATRIEALFAECDIDPSAPPYLLCETELFYAVVFESLSLSFAFADIFSLWLQFIVDALPSAGPALPHYVSLAVTWICALIRSQPLSQAPLQFRTILVKALYDVISFCFPLLTDYHLPHSLSGNRESAQSNIGYRVLSGLVTGMFPALMKSSDSETPILLARDRVLEKMAIVLHTALSSWSMRRHVTLKDFMEDSVVDPKLFSPPSSFHQTHLMTPPLSLQNLQNSILVRRTNDTQRLTLSVFHHVIHFHPLPFYFVVCQIWQSRLFLLPMQQQLSMEKRSSSFFAETLDLLHSLDEFRRDMNSDKSEDFMTLISLRGLMSLLDQSKSKGQHVVTLPADGRVEGGVHVIALLDLLCCYIKTSSLLSFQNAFDVSLNLIVTILKMVLALAPSSSSTVCLFESNFRFHFALRIAAAYISRVISGQTSDPSSSTASSSSPPTLSSPEFSMFSREFVDVIFRIYDASSSMASRTQELVLENSCLRNDTLRSISQKIQAGTLPYVTRNVLSMDSNGSLSSPPPFVETSLLLLHSLSAAVPLLPSVFADYKDRLQHLVSLILPNLLCHLCTYPTGYHDRYASQAIGLISSLCDYPQVFEIWKGPIFDLFFEDFFSVQRSRACLLSWGRAIDHIITKDRPAFIDVCKRRTNLSSFGLVPAAFDDSSFRCQQLHRLTFILFSGESDQHISRIHLIQEKIVEAFKVSANEDLLVELFLLLRVLFVRISPSRLRSFWPVVLTEIFQVFTTRPHFRAVYAAWRFVDFVITLSVDQFPYFEWIFAKNSLLSQSHLDAIEFPSESFFIPFLSTASDTPSPNLSSSESEVMAAESNVDENGKEIEMSSSKDSFNSPYVNGALDRLVRPFFSCNSVTSELHLQDLLRQYMIHLSSSDTHGSDMVDHQWIEENILQELCEPLRSSESHDLQNSILTRAIHAPSALLNSVVKMGQL